MPSSLSCGAHSPRGQSTIVAGTTATDDTGAFRVSGGMPDAHHALAFDPGGQRGGVYLVEESLVFGRHTRLRDVVLPETGIVTGRVVDRDGQPVAQARVRLAPRPAARADADGRYRFNGIPGGRYRISVTGSPDSLALLGFELPEKSGPSRVRESISLGPGEEGQWNLRFQADGTPRPGWLEGSIRLDGIPQTRGTVILEGDTDSHSLPVDGTGRFRSDDLPAGSRWNLSATIAGLDPRGVPFGVRVPMGTRTIPQGRAETITLSRKCYSLTVQVMSTTGHAPIQEAEIWVRAGDQTVAGTTRLPPNGTAHLHIPLEPQQDPLLDVEVILRDGRRQTVSVDVTGGHEELTVAF